MTRKLRVRHEGAVVLKGLPPGTLLQLMYLRARLAMLPSGRFVKIGPGAGEITRLLLAGGWSGTVFDFDPDTCQRLQERFPAEVQSGRLSVHQGDYLEAAMPPGSVDLVISCMVMEHFDDGHDTLFLRKALHELKVTGRFIALVSASMRHWGIEDDIAGHCRCYGRADIARKLADAGAAVLHMAGLTFLVANVLLPLSNFLVKRAESNCLAMDMHDRTRYSGKREVNFKTRFPAVFDLVLNEWTMLPLYGLQWICRPAAAALVLYVEAEVCPSPLSSYPLSNNSHDQKPA